MVFNDFLAYRRFVITNFMDFRSKSDGALSLLMILWFCLSFDTSFLSSDIMRFHNPTLRIAASSVGDHGY